jgi:hypothetical protein
MAVARDALIALLLVPMEAAAPLEVCSPQSAGFVRRS